MSERHDEGTGPRLLELPVVCPRCHERMVAAPPAWRCGACDEAASAHRGWLDFVSRADGDRPGVAGGGPAQRLMHAPLFARVYEDYWRPLFVSVAGGRRADFEAEMSWILEQLRHAEDGVVLDHSCGPALVGRRLLASRRFARVFALDHARAMLDRALDACARESLEGLELVRADAMALPFADASLDAVHAGAALHIWPQVDRVLAEIHRVLRPGAIFVASTFEEDPTARRWGVRAMGAGGAKVFDRGELELRCRRAGFKAYAQRRVGNMVWLRCEA